MWLQRTHPCHTYLVLDTNQLCGPTESKGRATSRICSHMVCFSEICYFNARKPSIHSSFTWISRICLFYMSVLDVGVWPFARQRHATCPGMPKQYADAAPPSRRPEQLNYRVKGSCETTFGEQSPFETHVLCNCHFFIAGNRKTSKLENDFLLSLSGWIFGGF